MNLHMSLHKQAYWTPILVVVECLDHSTPLYQFETFSFWKVYSVSSDFAWSLLNFECLTNKIKIYVFN